MHEIDTTRSHNECNDFLFHGKGLIVSFRPCPHWQRRYPLSVYDYGIKTRRFVKISINLTFITCNNYKLILCYITRFIDTFLFFTI